MDSTLLRIPSPKPREKLLHEGASSLTDEELLALFLRTGSRGKGVMRFARDLLERAGGVRGLLEMDPVALGAIPGLGPAKTAQLAAILEFARRYLVAEMPSRDILNSTEDLHRYFKLRLQGFKEEVLVVIFLSGRNEVLAIHEMGFLKDPNKNSVPLRELAKRGLACGASAFLLAHNHPFGDSKPSREDLEMTRTCVWVGRFLGLALYEHLILGESNYFSFRNTGLIGQMDDDFNRFCENASSTKIQSAVVKSSLS